MKEFADAEGFTPGLFHSLDAHCERRASNARPRPLYLTGVGGVPEFMDVHRGMVNITPKALRDAHQADLDIQDDDDLISDQRGQSTRAPARPPSSHGAVESTQLRDREERMFRRTLIVSLLAGLIATALPHAAVGAPAHVEFGRRVLHRNWIAWAVGSDTNPLVDPEFCGEMVGDRFYMNLAATLEATYDCQVPEGVTIVAAAGYTIYWKPTDGRTDRELRQGVNADLPEFGGPRGRLDGERIDLDRAFRRTGVYSVRLGEDSLIRSDPKFPGRRRTDVAAGAWVFKIVGLAVGDHRFVVTQRVFGERARAVFHISVVAYP